MTGPGPEQGGLLSGALLFALFVALAFAHIERWPTDVTVRDVGLVARSLWSAAIAVRLALRLLWGVRVLLLILLLLGLRRGQHPVIVFGVLEIVLRHHAIAG